MSQASTTRKAYPSDLTDEQWAILEPLIPPSQVSRRGGRPRDVEMREVQRRPEGTTGFTPLAERWVVERTNAWNGRCRRHSKDYERTVESSAGMIQVRHVHRLLR